MRKERKMLIFCMLLLSVLLVSPVIISTPIPITIGTLQYQETRTFTVNGNISLFFDTSDTGNEDISIILSVYSSAVNKTVLTIRSDEISYDWSFVNDTKTYFYIDLNSGDAYKVFVNYSSIQVPRSPIQILQEQLDQANETMRNLMDNITRLNASLDLMRAERNSWINSSNSYQNQLAVSEGENTPLREQIYNLTTQIRDLGNRITDLQNDNFLLNENISARENAITQLSDSWSTGYTLDGVSHFHINFFYISITILIMVIIFAFILQWIRAKSKGEKPIVSRGADRVRESMKKAKLEKAKADVQDPDQVSKEIDDFHKSFLKEEKISEVKDRIEPLKESHPDEYKKLVQKLDEMKDKPKKDIPTEDIRKKIDEKQTKPQRKPAITEEFVEPESLSS